MPKLSVLIPNYNSPFTSKTVDDILEHAGCDVEVIVNVEHQWPELSRDSRVTYTHPNSPIGMRSGINRCAKLATGEYIMKSDDHCAFSENFGKILIESHQDNWVQVPSRYALDPVNWKREERTDNKYPIDQMYIDFPRKGKDHDDGMHGVEWRDKRDHTQLFDLVESPSLQGSCWFMTKDYFDNFLGGMHPEIYGEFAQEAQEIGFKTWLGGGAVMINRVCWYAHLHKGQIYGRMYKMPPGNVEMSNKSAEHWLNNREPNMIHTFAWFINEKFPDMPSWPQDWQQQIKEMGWTN